MSDTIYQFKLKKIGGEEVSLEDFRGKVCLIVNVASKWGFTKSNYSQLQQLYSEHEGAGLRILGFPCNQFGKQEPGTNAEIEKFARETHGATWDLFEKIEVNGKNADPLFDFLKNHKNGKGFITNNIKWNFTKFLIGRDGVPAKRYGPKDSPKSFEKDIKAELDKPVSGLWVAWVRLKQHGAMYLEDLIK